MGRALVASQAGGAWSGSAELEPPTNADASLFSVACGAPGACSAVGSYALAGGDVRPMATSRPDGTWLAGTALGLPAAANGAPEATLSAVACGAAGSCAAIGFYKDGAGTD